VDLHGRRRADDRWPRPDRRRRRAPAGRGARRARLGSGFEQLAEPRNGASSAISIG
jgi:hypothetical protein